MDKGFEEIENFFAEVDRLGNYDYIDRLGNYEDILSDQHTRRKYFLRKLRPPSDLKADQNKQSLSRRMNNDKGVKKLKKNTRKGRASGNVDSAGTHDVCRGCLAPCGRSKRVRLFSTWTPPFLPSSSAVCIGELLGKAVDVQMSEEDGYPQQLCRTCFVSFTEMFAFMCSVRRSDRQLRARAQPPPPPHAPPLRLPGPIRFDPSAVGVARGRGGRRDVRDEDVEKEDESEPSEVTVKQEVLSDEGEDELELELDIKIEPEELVGQYDNTPPADDVAAAQPTSSIVISNSYSVQSTHLGEPDSVEHQQEQWSESPSAVKEELDDEDMELDSDVPPDCMLCHKTFHTTTGLKAHVITSHSYTSVRRRGVPPTVEPETTADSAGESSATQHRCLACSKKFSTTESLSVHERVHETSCPGCACTFTSFVSLAQHRRLGCASPPPPSPSSPPPLTPGAVTRTVRQLKREHADEHSVESEGTASREDETDDNRSPVNTNGNNSEDNINKDTNCDNLKELLTKTHLSDENHTTEKEEKDTSSEHRHDEQIGSRPSEARNICKDGELVKNVYGEVEKLNVITTKDTSNATKQLVKWQGGMELNKTENSVDISDLDKSTLVMDNDGDHENVQLHSDLNSSGISKEDDSTLDVTKVRDNEVRTVAICLSTD